MGEIQTIQFELYVKQTEDLFKQYELGDILFPQGLKENPLKTNPSILLSITKDLLPFQNEDMEYIIDINLSNKSFDYKVLSKNKTDYFRMFEDIEAYLDEVIKE